MYSGLQSCIRLNDSISIPFQSTVGLKQGCNLSPLLFNIFINDLVVELNTTEGDAPLLGQSPVGCLLYADDLILISESKTGLQKSLDNLESYIKKWFLEVNLSKTKCLTFSKGHSKKNKNQWALGDKQLESCESYCYLGVVFASSGSMNAACKALKDKALGAMFSLIRNINKHRSVDPALLLDLFDRLVVPIALYNSEIWGTSFLPKKRTNVSNILGHTALIKHQMENLHHLFGKMVLGVPSRTSNWAVMSELGRYPLAILAWERMIKYWQHLNSTSSDILNAAFSTNVHLHMEGYSTWYSYLVKILEHFKLEYLDCILDHKELLLQLNNIKGKLQTSFTNKWGEDKLKFQSEGKIELLASLLGNFGQSSYLSKIAKPNFRIALTRMRVSAHKFPIESGRYLKTPRAERECSLGCKVLGDEYHYMTKCEHPFIKDIINRTHNKISLIDNTFGQLNTKSKFTFMLTNDNPRVLNLVGQLCYKVQEQFKDLTY